MGLGALSPAMMVPAEIQTLGLVLFVYCVGLQAAPGFFQCLKRDGLRLNAALATALLGAAAICWLAVQWSGRPASLIVGLFCGALTNTPALGAATETLARAGASPAELNSMVVGYGVAYPFAVLATLLLMQLRLGRTPDEAISQRRVTLLTPALTLIVEKNDPMGKPWRAEAVARETGLLLTRYQKPAGRIELVTDDTELSIGTRVVAVGNPEQIRLGLELLGKVSPARLQDEMKGLELHRYFVSKREIVGRPLSELGIEKLGAVVSRLRRGDVDLPVNDQTSLHLGDRVRVISYRSKEPAVRAFFGNSLTVLTETGYFSFGVGILLGLALGYFPIPVPGMDISVRLGVAGGPLIVALVLGSLGRSGPMVWNLPIEVNLTVRNLGILLFLAAVGVKAGAVLPSTLRDNGLFLMGLAVSVVLVAHLTLWLLLWRLKRSDLATLLGTMAGMQTQPAALSFAAEKIDPGPLNTAYAAVYPWAVIQKIILAQLLITFLR
ncbi:MAG: TrkA C-terminal domain-containing protein [Verrucomicrobiota bacterium]